MPERERPGGLQQQFERVSCVEFVGSEKLHHREGGNKPLFVKETQPGCFVSSWMIDSKPIKKTIKDIKRRNNNYVLSLVVDTNVPGHPTVSMQVQEIFITKG